MISLEEKFKALEANNAPGQEVQQAFENLDAIMQA